MFEWLYRLVYGEKDRIISELRTELNTCKNSRKLYEKDNLYLTNKYNDLLDFHQELINDTKDKINELKQENMELRIENRILQKEFPIPVGFKEGKTYLGKRSFWTTNKVIDYTLPKIQDYFLVTSLIDREVNRSRAKNEKTDFDKFKRILSYVQFNFRYNTDQNKFGRVENWEPIDNIILSRSGDCETLSMLVVMMCRRAGIPADKILMALGKWGDIGHGWVIFYDDEWYIGESTARKSPMKWSEHPEYKCIWGAGNDIFSLEKI